MNMILPAGKAGLRRITNMQPIFNWIIDVLTAVFDPSTEQERESEGEALGVKEVLETK